MCECDGLGVDFGVFSEDLTRRCTVKAPALASRLGIAPARLLRLLRARLAALDGSALPGRGRPTGRPAIAQPLPRVLGLAASKAAPSADVLPFRRRIPQRGCLDPTATTYDPRADTPYAAACAYAPPPPPPLTDELVALSLGLLNLASLLLVS